VGRALARLLADRQDLLRNRYGLSPKLRAIFRSTGGLMVRSPATVEGLILGEALPARKAALWDPKIMLPAALKLDRPGVFVDCTPGNIRTGQPGLDQMRLALGRGWHVVTANKGPLVVGYRELRRAAAGRGLGLRFSAAAGAALPALDVGLRSLAGTRITAIEGILNGTTNYILTRLGQGATFGGALKEAQDKGIAEPDPTLDLEGWDTAVKLLLIANAVMGLELKLEDIDVEPMSGVSPRALAFARKNGRALKFLGRIGPGRGGVTADVRVRAVASSHPLFGVDGTNKGVTFVTDTMGSVTVTGGRSDPRGAAAALLKDIIDIYRN